MEFWCGTSKQRTDEGDGKNQTGRKQARDQEADRDRTEMRLTEKGRRMLTDERRDGGHIPRPESCLARA